MNRAPTPAAPHPLHRWEGLVRRAPGKLALMLALIHFALAASFSVVNPLGEAPDEADHWAYIVHLATVGSLPEGPQVTQSKHPPAYHATAALAASVGGEPDFSFLRANPDISLTPTPTRAPNFFIHTAREAWPWQGGARAFHVARLWTALLNSATVLATFGLARTVWPAWPGFAVLVAAGVAFWPQFVFLGGALNNDTPVALWSTLALWGGFAVARARDGHWSPGWWTPLALGLGLLTKLSAAAIWPIVALSIVLGRSGLLAPPAVHREMPASPGQAGRQIWRRRGAWFAPLLLIFGLALLMAAPWFWRNWQLYADPLGIELARQTIDQRTTPWGWAETRWLLTGWFLSFWGKFGAVGHIPYPTWVYGAAGLLSAASLAGLVKGAIYAATASRAEARRKVGLPLALMLLTAIMVAGGIWRYSLIALGTDQGRLLFPALAPLLILFLMGLRAWIPAPARTLAGTILAAGLCALTLYGLLGIVRPAYAPPLPPLADELAERTAPAPQHEAVRFGELTLVGHQLADEPILYWQAIDAPQTDWRIILRVVAEDGTLVWEWRRSPAAGRWSTDRWPPGALVRDAYAIQWPAWAGPGRYLVEVGVYPFGGDTVAPQSESAPLNAEQEHPYLFLGWLTR